MVSRTDPVAARGVDTPAQREPWFAQDPDRVVAAMETDAAQGLRSTEAAARLSRYGPNQIAGEKPPSVWAIALVQLRDPMNIMLVAVVVVSLLIGQVSTAVIVALLIALNVVLGTRQELKARASVDALAKMQVPQAKAVRDGEVALVAAAELVPGDVVALEAGDIVPVDGRILRSATLEVQEAALTGESAPVAKDAHTLPAGDVPIGDRSNMLFQNTSVSRGTATMVATETGMATQMGRIATMLTSVTRTRSPLQKELGSLTKVLGIIAWSAVAFIVVVGAIRGLPFTQLLLLGTAMAISAIPTGMPAFVSGLLSFGANELARAKAIVKNLTDVETLGSTSAINTDKTGTLTLNQMMVSTLFVDGAWFAVEGEGYRKSGAIRSAAGTAVPDFTRLALGLVLCSDATVDDDGGVVGDPTEAALVVLAAKLGVDAEETRRAYPRLAEVPFDSDYKFMATFHEMTDAEGRPVVRCYVKGAPDVLIGRGGSYRAPDGTVVPVTDDNRHLALDANDAMANAGQRVMVVAQRDLDPAEFQDARARGDAALLAAVDDLTLLAMVGIVDPPRAEAKAAIAECRAAGIRVRMITGDHATTAAAIATELGIEGRALSGTQFAALSDDELLAQLDDIGVVARVAPEDKIRLVQLLKRQGNVVAMTGDGVNDAPALKAADIGVAMGITGTEVSQEAAVMILTDDNFATIVNAVSYGRTLYDNLLKYLRFQMSTLVAYIAIFLTAGIADIAGGVPLEPLQILWLNMVIDIPIAIALGFDKATSGLMTRDPRPVGAPVLSVGSWVRICVQGAVMTIGTLVAYRIGEEQGGALVGATMLLTTLSLFHVVAGLLSRDQVGTVFDRDALPGAAQLRRYGVALVAIVAVTTIDLLTRVVGVTGLSGEQWGICVALAATLVVTEEAVKLALRSRRVGSRGLTVESRAVPVGSRGVSG
jgi:P-type Ca2+ transporter type 2C